MEKQTNETGNADELVDEILSLQLLKRFLVNQEH
jgi:hypothetical protein